MEKNIFGLVKKFLQVARVHKKMAWGLAKMASVASGFDPTRGHFGQPDPTRAIFL